MVQVCNKTKLEMWRTCSQCVTDILDPNTQATVGGNNYFVCDSSDNLQVTTCLFYCLFYLNNFFVGLGF